MTDLKNTLMKLINELPAHEGKTFEEALAEYLIAEGVTVQRWIPVTERLPKGFGTFLVAIDEVHGDNRISVDAADYDPVEKTWSTFNYFCAGYKVTHWMPIPEPPKEVE